MATRALVPVRRQAVHVLRRGRDAALTAARPLDWLSLALNGKRDYPPVSLRRYVGPLRSFESSASEYAAYLKVFGGLRPTSRLLDVGCGCGAVPLQLDRYFAPGGGYWGVDIDARSIEWCERVLAARHPELHFRHIDVHSAAYNRGGREPASRFRFPFDDASFDVLLVKSVFTHMRPPDVERYLAEMARVLAPGGRCVVTFFLLNDAQRAHRASNRLSFDHGEGPWRYVHEESPETAAAYEEGWLLEVLGRSGLRLARPIAHGRWSGRPDGFTFQDLVVLEGAG